MDPKAVKAAYQAILRLAAAETFRLAWCRETARPDLQSVWDEKAPTLGQCDATAIVLQGICGGDIMQCDVIGYGHHYYNVLPDGTELDLTSAQFPAMTGIPRGKPVDPDDMLNSTEGQRTQLEDRRELLNDLVFEALSDIRDRFDALSAVLP